MNKHFRSIVLRSTGASSLVAKETIQKLWSGYGEIRRIELIGADVKSVIVKHVQLKLSNSHPRGWNTDIGHQRKVKSYHVETNWYEKYSTQSTARLPHSLAVEHHEDQVFMVLEDLDAAGFSLRKQSLDWIEIKSCLRWLAEFHASFLRKKPDGLWEVGTYWHLETRPQELEELKNQRLKEAASRIDQKLNSCEYKTFVHGDAKLANFCFGEDGKVAAVDFQYVGGGCGMKDVAYFIGSVLNEIESERLEEQILDTYFEFLQNELTERNEALESEWRSMYRVAWADFHRFLEGWSPGHWKINSYSERVIDEVIKNL
ncbi:MAG: ecdysteroid 22-kinase family protein [Balneolales bacterium]|nr:ecdysteroid 22-kinase family protein [Balneolales bacterium]